MWHSGKKILQTFVHHTTQWAWANVDGLGWKRIREGAPDGVTNLHVLLCVAQAEQRDVSVHVDTDDLITTAYLF
jgi:hypothetical protein